jgi:DNA-binding CsgD family transcriptional regulator
MREVLGRGVAALAQNMRRVGVPTESAIARLGMTESALREPGCRVDWSACAEFLEVLEQECGGPEGLERAFALAQPRLFSEFLPLFRFVLSPRDLYRLIHKLIAFAYPHLSLSERDAPDGTLVVTIEIPKPHRPCSAFFHACAGGMRAVPEIVGLPRSEVAAVIEPHRGVFTLSLPESRTLAARLRRASVSRIIKAAAAEVEQSWAETRRRIAELEAANAALVQLTRRLDEESAAQRLVRATAAWRLTPRQAEVVALVIRGLSNKEIAAALDCALHTVELHVTEALRRSGASSRTALVAAFWSS